MFECELYWLSCCGAIAGSAGSTTAVSPPSLQREEGTRERREQEGGGNKREEGIRGRREQERGGVSRADNTVELSSTSFMCSCKHSALWTW